MKRTPSKRKSHIERIQEENKELLKSMGIEELATSESRSTRRSTRSNTKGPAPDPVTPPTPKRQPATPTSSRRGKKKMNEVDSEESGAVEISSPIQPTPSKRQKLSETTKEDIAAEENPKKGSPVEESMEVIAENTLESSTNEQSADHIGSLEGDAAEVCKKFEGKPISTATVVSEPMPDTESAKIKDSFEGQISSTSEKVEEAPLVDEGKQENVPELVAESVAKASSKSPEPIVEAVKAESEPTQVFEISSENRSQVVAVEKTLPFESATEQSKIETTQGECSCNAFRVLCDTILFQMNQFQHQLKPKELSKPLCRSTPHHINTQL